MNIIPDFAPKWNTALHKWYGIWIEPQPRNVWQFRPNTQAELHTYTYILFLKRAFACTVCICVHTVHTLCIARLAFQRRDNNSALYHFVWVLWAGIKCWIVGWKVNAKITEYLRVYAVTHKEGYCIEVALPHCWTLCNRDRRGFDGALNRDMLVEELTLAFHNFILCSVGFSGICT